MRKQITLIIAALVIIVVGVVSLLMSYPRLEGKTYFLKKYEKTDSAAIQTGYYGNLIMFQNGFLKIIEIEEGASLLKEAELVSQHTQQSAKGDEVIMIPPKATISIYANPKLDRGLHQIMADELEDKIEVINSKEIKYKGYVYQLIHDKTKVEYLKSE